MFSSLEEREREKREKEERKRKKRKEDSTRSVNPIRNEVVRTILVS